MFILSANADPILEKLYSSHTASTLCISQHPPDNFCIGDTGVRKMKGTYSADTDDELAEELILFIVSRYRWFAGPRWRTTGKQLQ